MTRLYGFLIVVAALILGVWWWRKTYVVPPLESHYNELEARQATGNLAQYAAYVASIPVAMVGELWGTTAIVNPTNPSYNTPGTSRFNFRFLQPTGVI